MAKCEMCGKHTVFGKKVAQIRSGLYSRTNRKIKPNLQQTTVIVNGQKKHVTLCTHCKRTQNRIRS